MTDQPAAGRGRAWAVVIALALATLVLSVVQAPLLMFVPLGLLFIALPPRRPIQLALGLFIGWMALRVSPSADTLWYFGRGWVLLVAAWFVVAVVAMPTWRFFQRALAAVAAAVVTAAVILAVSRGGWAVLDAAVSAELRAATEQMLAVWRQAAGPEGLREDMSRLMYTAATWQTRLFPAMLALASITGLGVAWWMFSRVVSGPVETADPAEPATPARPQPLGRLREFRFQDELVWVFIGGVALMLLPVSMPATRLGENVAAFMAALYAVRGAGVLASIGIGSPGPIAYIVGALLLVLLYPFAMATAFIVGLSDTWLDIRARRQASPGSGS